MTEAVMESTGQYGRAVWNILEGELPRLILVNPAHVKALAGRKTLTRSRLHLLQEVNRVKNRLGQMCEAGAQRATT